MICNICGGSESYSQDGIEYCRECSEQIKGSIDEDAGDECYSKKSLLSSPVVKKEKKEKTRVLAPWLHFEAYNLILSKQVSALIKLGCSEKLKTVVFCIWARYLQKCGTAFAKSNKKTPRLSVFASKRDIELLYGEGVSTNLYKMTRPYYKITRRYCKRKDTQKVPKTEFPTDSAVSSSGVTSDEGSESPLKDFRKRNKVKRPKLRFSAHAKKIKKKGYKRTDAVAQEVCVSHMTLAKTLSFCQLGLLYTEDQMLLFDLLRLVNEGAVPFIDVTQHFPNTMQLQSRDNLYFTKHAAPDIQKVSLTSAQLIDFLLLPKFKLPSLLPIAIRFVKDLNLPCDLIPVLKLLINKLNKDLGEVFVERRTRSIFPLPCYEAQAMSVVAVALKMLFVLDGKFEVEHSEIMTKLNSICEDRKYFVWKDWQQQMALKEYLFVKKYTMSVNTMNRLDRLSADRINGGYPINLYRPELTTLAVKKTQNDSITRKALKTLFEGLVEDNSIKRNPTSFPFRYELYRLMTDWRRLPLFKNTENIDFSFINKDFSQHKLYYRPSATTDEPTDLLLSSLYESIKLIHIAHCHKYYHENIIRTSRKYWFFNCATIDFRFKKGVNEFPSSFRWLFDLMCNYLQVSELDFYKEFKYVECKLTQ